MFTHLLAYDKARTASVPPRHRQAARRVRPRRGLARFVRRPRPPA